MYQPDFSSEVADSYVLIIKCENLVTGSLMSIIVAFTDFPLALIEVPKIDVLVSKMPLVNWNLVPIML
jgi:hypothetical protein